MEKLKPKEVAELLNQYSEDELKEVVWHLSEAGGPVSGLLNASGDPVPNPGGPGH